MSGRKPLADPDAFYDALVRLHEGLDAEQGRRLNARLILLLAERVTDEGQLWDALRDAAAGLPHRSPEQRSKVAFEGE